MSRYIDLDLAIEMIDAMYSIIGEKAILLIWQQIKDLPTADVAEVRHGRWELYDICSVCGAQAEQQTNYCPNCGAKMDGEESGTRMDNGE